MNDYVHSKGSLLAQFFLIKRRKHSDYFLKAFLVMKITGIIILMFSLHVSAGSFAQKVSVTVTNADLKIVFKEVRKQTGYDFIYNNSVLAKAKPVTVRMKNQPLEAVLREVFTDQPLIYTIEDKVIIIHVKNAEGNYELQDRVITGTITSADDENPLPGVSVRVKGTSVLAAAGVNGAYSITLPAGATTLVFNYIGFKTKEVVVGAGKVLNVKLELQNSELNEVVVQAYGTTRKSALTNSVATIDSKDIELRPITNLNSAIAGAAPGLQTTGGSGQPGAGPSIRIRGFSSITGGVDPLYIVDGAPYDGAYNNINPDDIESISILKDASSAALYGSRAASGVILITTKKGKKNSNKLTARITHGINSRGVGDYETVSAFEYYPLIWESLKNQLVSNGSADEAARLTASQTVVSNLVSNPFNVADDQVVLTDGTINTEARLLYPEDLDWKKALQRNGQRDEYSINYSGGSDKSDFFSSLNYLKDEGYSLLTDFKRLTGRVNINSQTTRFLKTGLNVAGTTQKTKVANENSGIWENPFYVNLLFAPIYAVHKHDPATGEYLTDENGEYVYDDGLARPIAPGRNVIAETEYNENYNTRNFLSGRTYGEITFLKDFKFTTNLSLDVNNYRYNVYDNNKIGDGATLNGRVYKTASTSTWFNMNQLLNYNKKTGRHSIDLLLGHENYEYKYNYLYATAQGQIMSGSTEIKNFSTPLTSNSYEDVYRLESYFARGQYSFDDRYFFSASFRTDASSKFYKSKRWGDFWSVGAGWQIDKEPFFHVDWIERLKLRSSYGQVGSDNLNGYYLYQTLYDVGFNNGSEAGVKQSTILGNNDLVWESNNSFDAALEVSALKGRVDAVVEYFNRETDNLLFDVPLPLSSGLNTINKNFGSLYNRGFEIQLNGNIIKKKDLQWRLGINWTKVNNKIKSLPFDERIDGTKKYMVGHSRYDFWLRDWYGVDPATGSELFVAEDQGATNAFVNDQGVTVTTSSSNALYHYAGTAIPDFYGSINNTLTYKRFTLDFRVLYSVGGLAYDNDYQSLMYGGTYGRALHKDALQRWQGEGQVTDVPKRIIGASVFDSDRWLVDASYLSLKTANLNYTLPKAVVKKLALSTARIYLSGENLYLLAKRKGLDATQAFNGNPSYTYAPARTISLGINVSF